MQTLMQIEPSVEDQSDEKVEEPPSSALYSVPAPAIVSIINLDTAPTARAPRQTRSTAKTRDFRKRFYPDISDKQWNDWQWQIGNRINKLPHLETLITLSEDERIALSQPENKLPLGITPYYASLISRQDALQPLRRTVIPTTGEFLRMPCEADDPLHEEAQSPVPGLVHRYPDRALLLVLDFCSTYCRYCTRSRVVGKRSIFPSKKRLERAIDYIAATPAIHDVILSGGDPLTLNDDRLDWLLTRLRRIPHLDIIRIGTKVPAVLPQRITPKLTRMLKKHHPLWMSLHFTHPDEGTPETYRACGMLADAGIPLGSQTVLLKGINDQVDTMRELVYHLLKMRVRPYYLYQCDPITGSGHFRTPIQKGLDIIRGLRGFISGYAVPTYVVDAPGGGGKIPLLPEYRVGRAEGNLLLSNYENRVFRYPDTATEDGLGEHVH
ncbi:MAG: KamA family radical SAM protein [Desulfobacterales bacterium]|nr:KamA family radical SAM protein [Desulfobacterales bacterium]